MTNVNAKLHCCLCTVSLESVLNRRASADFVCSVSNSIPPFVIQQTIVSGPACATPHRKLAAAWRSKCSRHCYSGTTRD